MSLVKNQEIELQIESFSSEGSGVGHYDKMAVFVSGAVVGDKALVHIIKAKKTYAIGKAVKILKPSKDRTDSDCEASASCGGCAFRHIKYGAELEMKRQKVENAFLRLGGIDKKIDEMIGAESITGYRNKAEYPVGFDGRLKIGFYASHTHRIIDCPRCALQPEVFSEIVKIIRKWIVEYGISVYNPETGKGIIRHIYIRQGAVSKEIMVCLVVNSDFLPKKDKLLERLLVISDIKSVVININKDKTNVILGRACKTLWGDDYIYDELCGVKIRLSPLSFYQVNPVQTEKLYSLALSYAGLTGKESVWDLYCGIGTISLFLSGKASKVYGVEVVPQAIEDAKQNAANNGITNAEFFVGKAEEVLPEFYGRKDAVSHSGNKAEQGREDMLHPDVIVVDPPRKGCDEMCLQTMLKMAPDRIVYVSCDSATLARDLRILCNGGYELERVRPVDMFPQTVHVETVVLLSHKKPDGHINVKVEFGEGEGKVPLDNIAKRAEEYKPRNE